jgi:SAM-dependent methyltransferase
VPRPVRKFFRRLRETIRISGLDTRRLRRSLKGLLPFLRDLVRYRRAPGAARLPLLAANLRPMLWDRWEKAGDARGHYFHQDLWAARRIFQRRPARHVDVGSRVDGFVAHLLAFMDVELIDVRPLTSAVRGLRFVQDDATDLRTLADGSITSLSSLHAVEHFGLGRYGDPVDPEACFKAMRAMARVVSPGGHLYFSVPIGRERVEFNAHRIFAPATVLDTFGGLELVGFAAVDDRGDLVEPAEPNAFAGADFACGLFEFTKRLPHS